MKPIRIRVLAVAIALGGGTLLGACIDVHTAWAADISTKEKRAKLERRIALLTSTQATFTALAAQPPPKKMTAKEKAIYEAHTAWLADGAKRSVVRVFAPFAKEAQHRGR